jgi:DNA-binding Xre family transcriptional regulator/Mn-dependent DtxR family transcriptional regulator
MSKTYIIDALRLHLKARNITYKELAQAIDLSEVSVKRLFTGGDCGLDRLEQICQYLHLEFRDLFKTTPRKRKLITQLSLAQEQEFAQDNHLLMVAVCALTHWPVADIHKHLQLTRGQVQKLLKRLDDMGFLDVQASDRYRLLVANNFGWISGGPIMRMVQSVSDDFFNDTFEGDGEILKIMNVRISHQAQEQLKARLEQIAVEYEDQARADSHLPLQDRPPLSVCIAVRTWVPKFMRDLYRLEAQPKPPSTTIKAAKASKTRQKPSQPPAKKQAKRSAKPE